MKIHNVNIVVLPSHTSHITQMFDVLLASALKVTYKEKLMRVCKRDHTESLSTIGFHRYNSIVSLISTWYYIADIQNCIKSAKLTGYYPFNPDIVYSSRFITSTNLQIQNNRIFLNMNGKVITDDQVYQEILDAKGDNSDILYSSLNNPIEGYKNKILRITHAIKDKVSVFTPYPLIINNSETNPFIINFLE